METLPDLVARDRRSDETALVVGDRSYTYRRFCTQSWKAGNVLRHLGVREGTTVAVDADSSAKPILATFGTALLGGIVRLDPPRAVDARAVVAPGETVQRYDLPEGGQRAGYGDDPEDPSTYHFEEQLWSENPTRVPRSYDSDAPVVDDGTRTCSHADLLAIARSVADRLSLDADDRVLVADSINTAERLAGGILAPLLVGGTAAMDVGDADAVVVASERTAAVDCDRRLELDSLAHSANEPDGEATETE